eukprot:EG_transcript_11093
MAVWEQLCRPAFGHVSRCGAAVFVANFCDYCLNSLCVPIFPDLLAETALPPHLTGVLFACKPAVQIFAGGCVGPMVDYVGPPTILVVGLGLLALSAVAFAVVLLNPVVTLPVYGWMVALRALQGVAAAMLVSAGMAWVAQAHPPAERDLAMGFVLMGNGAGALCGAVFGGLLAAALGNAAPFVAVAAVLLVDCAAISTSSRRTSSADEVAGRDPPPSRRPVDWRQALGLLTDRCVVCIVCLLFVANAGLTLLQPTLPLHAHHQFGYRQRGQGLVWGAVMLTFTVCRPVAASLSLALGRASVLLAGVLLLSAGLAVVGTAASLAGFLATLVGIGMGVAFVTTPCMPMMATVVELHGQQNYGVAYSLADVATSLGRTLGPVVGASLSHALAFPVMCQYMGLASTACLLCCLPLRGLARTPPPPKPGPNGS